jgi:hypothetical protein
MPKLPAMYLLLSLLQGMAFEQPRKWQWAEQLHGSAPNLSKSIFISTRLGGFFLASLGYSPSGG